MKQSGFCGKSIVRYVRDITTEIVEISLFLLRFMIAGCKYPPFLMFCCRTEIVVAKTVEKSV